MVTLSGEVAQDYQRRAATDSVRALMGVRGVTNQMTLPSGISSATVRADIEASGRDQARHAACGTAGVHSVKDRLTTRF